MGGEVVVVVSWGVGGRGSSSQLNGGVVVVTWRWVGVVVGLGGWK